MSSLAKIYLLRDFAAGDIMSEAQNPMHTPPPLTHCIRVYGVLIHAGGGDEPERS
jgi:hypothetical protein